MFILFFAYYFLVYYPDSKKKNILLLIISCKMFETYLGFPLFSLILILSVSISSSLSVDYRYANCAINSTCGNSQISYPFSERNQQQYCGHPDFKVNCTDESLTMEISNHTFSVVKIDYDAYVLTISNPSFINNPCPLSMTNSSLDLTLFKLAASSQNATLFYNCSSSSVDKDAPNRFTCPTSVYSVSTTSNLAFLATEQKWEQILGGVCNVRVYNPVLKSSVLGLASNSSNITEVLKMGFDVKLKYDDKLCDSCQSSEGVCGYNYTLNRPACFCIDGAYGGSCNDSQTLLDHVSSSKKNSRRSIIIGVGVAVGGSLILLLGILFFLLQHQHKKRLSSPSFLAQNKPLNVSSAASDLQTMNNSTYFGVPVFSYKELEEVTDNFNPLTELGDGGFGTVYYGKLEDGREVAIKRLYEHNDRRAQQFMNEVEILAHLRHTNLVTLYGCTHHRSRELLLVYEYVSNGTVSDHLYGKIAKNSPLSWAMRLNIAVETSSALVYLHASDIIHRDVKTQNILLDKDFSVKVADFGLSRLFPLDATHVSTAPQGTPGYVDPEYHQCYQLTEKSDVFSFGVVLAELISSKTAVDITRRRKDINLSSMATNRIQNHALHEFVDPHLGFESDCRVKKEITAVAELALRCLQSTSDMRPSMEQMLEMLLTIQGKGNQARKADEVDIPSDDVFMLKSDLSPSSSGRDDHLVRNHIPHASV